MDAAELWDLFASTGEPAYYLWYCRVRAAYGAGTE